MANSAFPLSATSGNLILLDSKTASNSAQLEFTGITNSYSEYIVVCTNIKAATSGASMRLRFNNDAGANYNFADQYVATTGTQGVGGFGVAQTQFLPVGNINNTLSYGLELHIFNPGSTDQCRLTWFYSMTNVTPSLIIGNGGGQYTGAAPVTSMQFTMSSGNITSGTIYLYGVLKTSTLGIAPGMAVGATQADMEAATSATTFVSPLVAQYHPGVTKSWCRFTTITTTTITSSYNVASLTDNGSGDTTVNLTVPFSNANYGVTASMQAPGSGATRVVEIFTGNSGGNHTPFAPTASAYRLLAVQQGVAFEDSLVCTTAFGDQ